MRGGKYNILREVMLMNQSIELNLTKKAGA